MKQKKFKVGEFVKLKGVPKEFPQPHGIVISLDGYFYKIKWFDSFQEDGGYVWASLEEV